MELYHFEMFFAKVLGEEENTGLCRHSKLQVMTITYIPHRAAEEVLGGACLYIGGV